MRHSLCEHVKIDFRYYHARNIKHTFVKLIHRSSSLSFSPLRSIKWVKISNYYTVLIEHIGLQISDEKGVNIDPTEFYGHCIAFGITNIILRAPHIFVLNEVFNLIDSRIETKVCMRSSLMELRRNIAVD